MRKSKKTSKIRRVILKFILVVTDVIKRVLLFFIPRKILRYIKNKYLFKLNHSSEISKIPYEAGIYPKGINLYGYFNARMGLGQGARLIYKLVEITKIPHVCLNLKVGNAASHREITQSMTFVKQPQYNTNLILVNTGQMDFLHIFFDQSCWDQRYNIAYWLWELEEFPQEWLKYIDLIDEIWVPSVFIYNIFKKVTEKPIHLISYGIEPQINPLATREDFKLPKDKLIFLVMFDSLSTIERKNPIAAIEAYKSAFKQHEDVLLVIKVNNKLQKDSKILIDAIEQRRDIMIISENFDMLNTHTLINLCDVFVSLHRSEGFGLVLAEAMYLKKVVIGTNWSGNVDFMNANNSCLVDYNYVTINEDINMYKKGNRWANPNVEQAILFMSDIYNNREKYIKIAHQAHTDIMATYSEHHASDKIGNRLKELELI